MVEAWSDTVVDKGSRVALNGKVVANADTVMTYHWTGCGVIERADTLHTATVANSSCAYYLTAYNSIGCASEPDTVFVDVYDCPSLASVSVPAVICEGDSAVVRVNVYGFQPQTNQYTWQISTNNGADWTNLSAGTRYAMSQDRLGGELRIRNVSTDISAGTAVFRCVVKATDSALAFCPAVISPDIELNVDIAARNLPSIQIVGQTDFCTNDAVLSTVYSVNITPGYEVAWKQNGSGVLEYDGNDHRRGYTVADGDKVIGVLYSGNTCIDRLQISDTLTVHFHPQPSLTAWTDTTIAYGDVAALHAKLMNGTGPVVYSWTPADKVL